MNNINLHDTMNARVWAKEWLKTIEKNPSIPTDERTMIGWFANAIVAGYDAGCNKMKQSFPKSCHGDGRPLLIGIECGWATNYIRS